jgi:putative transcriptional regulator
MREYIANEVYALRTKHGITQEALAQAVSVSRQTIIAIEKGKYTPSVHLALTLARYFKVPVEKLFTITYEK